MRSVAGLMKYNDSRKLTIEEMKKLAESRNGRFLSKEYVDALTKHKWQCKEGHVWEARPADIKKGVWCPHCSHRARLKIEEMHELAKSREGKCLSEAYVNNRAVLEWRCIEGHVWKSNAHDIKSGHWCPKCGIIKNHDKSRLTIGEMREIANSRGGKCLSDKYVNSNTKLKWQCKKGHIFESIPSSVKSGKWCLHCAGKTKRTLEELQKIAESKGGKCLSDTYVNVDTKIEFQCKESHVWKTTPYLIGKGNRCFRCSTITNAEKPHGKTTKRTIEQMHELAKLRDGKCLSEKYITANSLLKWQCKEGHIFEMRPNNVKYGQWCPNCARGIGERACRKFFEAMFGHNFPSSKPSWLVSKKVTRMELDGFCKELNLAFEYHGPQHYRDVGFFSKTMNFQKRMEYDKIKIELCKEHGVTLVHVPYTVKLEDIGTFIKSECKKLGISIPDENVALGDLKFYYPEKLKELQTVALLRGGKLLSDTYQGSYVKLKWQCEQGHTWKAVPNSIKNGRWCPYCSHKVPLTIIDMNEMARLKDGKCLSTKYVDTKTPILWECKEGHKWKAQPGNIRAGGWCSYCARNRKKTRLPINHS